MRVTAVWAAAMAMGVAVSGCAARGGHATAPPGGEASSWRYEVVADAGARQLRIEAWLPPGSLADLVVRRGAERFVRDAEVEDEDGWRDAAMTGAALHAPECSRGCHIRYRFELRRAAEALHDIDAAKAWGEVVEASPSVWLLHPTLAPSGTRYRLHVRTPGGLGFATGVFAAADGPPGTYEADATNLAFAPYAAFGPVRVRHVEAVAGATIDVAIAPGSYAAGDDALVAWVSRSARTMARFLGCFPIERVMVLVVPAPDAHVVRHGETMGDGGAAMVVEVGEEADAQALADDWVLPHEMAHLAVPSVSRRHHWIEEGLAVYVEPIARARSGELTAEQVWREFMLGMPKGVPAPGDARVFALDDTPDWARTYWGGATFCLLADVAIRRQTSSRLGLEDAMRGILASGGSVATIWDFDRLLETADASVGMPVLVPMHAAMKRAPWRVNLPALFRDLGVRVEGNGVKLVDDAPLASVRRAITEPLPPDAPDPRACPWASP
ncbi:MAG TPA: hypothetical protein VIF15_10600, partial [Polyangiaceae bacterium]